MKTKSVNKAWPLLASTALSASKLRKELVSIGDHKNARKIRDVQVVLLGMVQGGWS